MKKIYVLVFMTLISSSIFSQNLCRAYFSNDFNSVHGILQLYDNSYNTDSSSLNVISWQWNVTSISTGTVNFMSSQQHPSVLVDSATTSLSVCLTISTSNGCTSNHCDTIIINWDQQNNCHSGFSYQPSLDPIDNHTIFYGWAYYGAGTYVNAVDYQWTFFGGIPSTGTTNNPGTYFPGPGTYFICLTTTTPLGCISTYCDSVYFSDSASCYPFVFANIGDVSIPNGNDGYIELIVTGGTQPYQYNWDNMSISGPNAYNLTSGIYTVTVAGDNWQFCPGMTYTYQILDPSDSLNYVNDTLTTSVIDTCFGFIPDSSYISSITVSGNIVYVDWVFYANGQTAMLTVEYTYTYNGVQIVIVGIYCDPSKNLMNFKSYINIRRTTEIEENPSEDISVYPNPIKDFLNIEFNKQTSLKNIIRIYNDAGQLVFIKQVNENTSKVSINTSNFVSGMYLIKVEDTEGKFFTKKIIK